MSDAGRAYVEKHSPYTGTMFLIHLRLGNIENDTYNHRLFIADENLAKLCRCSTKSVQRAKAQMVEDGFLRLLRPASGRRVAEYEFLFPQTDVDITPDFVPEEEEIGGHFVRIGGHPVRIGGHFVPSEEDSPLYINKQKESTKSTSPASKKAEKAKKESEYESVFNDLWEIYPRKVGRSAALQALKSVLRSGVSPAELREAVVNYAAFRKGKEIEYTLHASTFFGPKQRWKDYLSDGEGLKTDTKKPKGFRGIEEFLQRGE